jgi:hypothetical protein
MNAAPKPSYACPSCGAPIVFSAAVVVCAVCRYCRTTVVRHDLDLEAVGKVAELQPETTPLQVGARGRFGGVAFSLIGRLQRRWERGFWSEWHALFDDMRAGWLAQAQGRYTLTFEQPVRSGVPTVEALQALGPGSELEVNARRYAIIESKMTTIGSLEGELPRRAVADVETLSVDLGGPDGRFATLELTERGAATFFAGETCAFDDLKLTNLRALDGW